MDALQKKDALSRNRLGATTVYAQITIGFVLSAVLAGLLVGTLVSAAIMLVHDSRSRPSFVEVWNHFGLAVAVVSAVAMLIFVGNFIVRIMNDVIRNTSGQ